jgi:acetylornithine deacetylase/succinyl-diaminopimelate desuccinylase-like protein
MSRLPDAVRDFITEARCKETLVGLVKVPSPLTELYEDEPQLKVFIAEAVEPRLRAAGVTAIRRDAMGNLIAEIGAGRSGRSLMLIANAMNQPQSSMQNAYEGEVRDGAAYDLPGEVVLGKGASEQKAVMAALLVAIAAVQAAGIGLAGRLIFVCCLSGETGRHDAIRSVIEGAGVRADMALLGGQGNTISLGNRGRIDVFITVRGVPAHSSRPAKGCNAITGAMAVIRLLEQEVDLSREHEDLGPATMAVTRIESFPKSSHTIQDRVEMTIDRRLLPGEDPEMAFAEIASIAARAGTDPVSGKPWQIEARLGPFMYPSLVAGDSAVVGLISEAMVEVVGREPERSFATSAFDQGYLNHVGIPTVNFGPGEQRFAHTDLDMASVTRTREAALAYAQAIVAYLG